ncbi:hypothetical protein SAMN05444955_103118 [Lihuaxuella thermophila]|uniref:Uncharacterized protein n=1 Tax=Lihuaxuella thermophila TaxID=1173111 RepID=A0A1H8C7B8_9BACL|nr:hypothetical protein SAMN05444955_103118 [Lihuaxuella thermophila]
MPGFEQINCGHIVHGFSFEDQAYTGLGFRFRMAAGSFRDFRFILGF